MATRTHPARALLHPLWLCGLVLLAVNDHLLKGAAVLPGWATGKVSDFAGLLVAPLVLIALLGLRRRRAQVGAHVAVGIGFSVINLWPAAAQALEALSWRTPLPWHITPDPTDLVALPMLAVSMRWLFGAAEPAQAVRPEFGGGEASGWLSRGPGRDALRWALLGLGLLFCAATSPAEPDCCDRAPVFPLTSARAMIGNDADADVVVRVREPLPGAVIDCATVRKAPPEFLSRRIFGHAHAWLIDPGRAVALPEGNASWGTQPQACRVYLVDGGGLSAALVFLEVGQHPVQSLPTVVSQIDNQHLIAIGGPDKPAPGVKVIGWKPSSLLFPPPPLNDPPASPSCALAPPTAGLDWAKPTPLGHFAVVDVALAPDGCAKMGLLDGVKVNQWVLCAPPGAIPFEAGDDVEIVGQWGGKGGATVDSVRITGAKKALWMARGDQPVAVEGLSIQSAAQVGCSGTFDSCGGLAVPLSVSVTGTLVGGQGQQLGAGQSASMAGGAGRFYVVRARRWVNAHPDCATAQASGQNHLETVWSLRAEE